MATQNGGYYNCNSLKKCWPWLVTFWLIFLFTTTIRVYYKVDILKFSQQVQAYKVTQNLIELDCF